MIRRVLIAISLVLYLFGGFSASAQSGSAEELMEKLQQKIKKVNDYSVESNIKVDMPFIKMFPSNAILYYKKVDKFKVVSKGISIVPRQGFGQMTNLMSDYKNYSMIWQGNEIIDGVKTEMISLISLSDTSDLIICKLWVDNSKLLILKTQLTTRSNGTIYIKYSYGKAAAYHLPDTVLFSLDVRKFKLPKIMGADINNSAPVKKEDEKKLTKGTIHITLKNYKINGGLSDEIFK